MEDMRCERARMLLALLSCGSGSSASGSASAKLFSMLFGRPGVLAPLTLACCSMPVITHMSWNNLWLNCIHRAPQCGTALHKLAQGMIGR